MKKLKLHCAAVCAASVLLFSAPNVLQRGTLKQVAATYLGNYRCETLRVGGIEFPCEDVGMEFSSDGSLTLRWKNLLGRPQSKSYPYTYDEEKEEFTVSYQDGKEERLLKIHLQNGEIVVSETLSGKAFFAKFVRK